MGRSKAPAPKRRRIEDEKAEQEAIQILLQAPQEQVEAAAAEATRLDCQTWPKLQSINIVHPSLPTTSATTTTTTTTPVATTETPTTNAATAPTEKHDDNNNNLTAVPDWLSGLGVSHTLPKEHFEALQALHQHIQDRATVWASWSGSPQDPRKRAFGFLPGTLGYQTSVRERLDISTPWKNNNKPTHHNGGGQNEYETDERTRNHKAMVVLEDLEQELLGDGDANNNNNNNDGSESRRLSLKHIRAAIDYICQHFATQVTSPTTKGFLTFENLIAAQPNLHCGRELLPIHVDHPTKDGFGVVIVTIGIKRGGTVLLQDKNAMAASQRATMSVAPGQAYMLSSTARNACAHGVLTDPNEADRESLNLRFGLHDFGYNQKAADNKGKPDDKGDGDGEFLPMISSREVLQHWEETA